MTFNNSNIVQRYYSGPKVAPFPMNYRGLDAPGRATELATIDAINGYYARSISYEEITEILQAAGVTERSISDHLSDETEEKPVAVAPVLSENYLSDYDKNSHLILLPEIFSGIKGHRSDFIRSNIRAYIAQLSSGWLSPEIFVKKVAAIIDYGVSHDEVLAFAESVARALPPKPDDEPEQELEPLPEPVVEQEEKRVIPFPPPAWIDRLPLDSYVKLPMFGDQQKAIKNALYSYCRRGNAELATNWIQESTFPQVWGDIPHWLSEIDLDRQKFITDRKNKAEKEKENIKENFQKGLQVLSEQCRTGQLSVTEYDQQIKNFKARVKILIEELEKNV